MSSLSENDIKKAVYDKPDGRGKFLLTSKLIIAQLLKFLIPDQFGNMSLKEIVKFCFDGNPENPFIELLSEENNKAGGKNTSTIWFLKLSCLNQLK